MARTAASLVAVTACCVEVVEVVHTTATSALTPVVLTSAMIGSPVASSASSAVQETETANTDAIGATTCTDSSMIPPGGSMVAGDSNTGVLISEARNILYAGLRVERIGVY